MEILRDVQNLEFKTRKFRAPSSTPETASLKWESTVERMERDDHITPAEITQASRDAQRRTRQQLRDRNQAAHRQP